MAGVAGVAGVIGEAGWVVSSTLSAFSATCCSEEPLAMAGVICELGDEGDEGDEGAGDSTTMGVAACSLALARAASCC